MIKTTGLESTMTTDDKVVMTHDQARSVLSRVFDAANLDASQKDNIVNRLVKDPYTNLVRHYHGPNHIASVFDNALQTYSECRFDDGGKQAFARFAIYHDAVFDVTNPVGANEYLSEQTYFYDILDWQCQPDVHLVSAAIIATAHHTEYRPWLAMFVRRCLDMDIYDLGTSAYWENNAKLRAEFLSVWPADKAKEALRGMLAGRLKWILAMLERPKIFYTPECAHLEQLARKNMGDDFLLCKKEAYDLL